MSLNVALFICDFMIGCLDLDGYCRRWGLTHAQIYCDRNTILVHDFREHTTMSQRHSVEMMESPPRVNNWDKIEVVLDSLKES